MLRPKLSIASWHEGSDLPPRTVRPPSVSIFEAAAAPGFLRGNFGIASPAETRILWLKMDASPPRRTLFTTLLGVVILALGALGTVFSLFALLMAVGKPYAVSHTGLLDILVLFILPPGTLLAGIGLILRHRWARWWIILLAGGVLWAGGNGVIHPWGGNPEFGGIPGPAADAMRQLRFGLSLACIAVGGGVLCGLWSAPVRREFEKPANNPPP